MIGGLGRILDPRTPRAVALHPVQADSTTRLRRRWKEPIRLNQGATGTCVANAFGHRRAGNPIGIEGIDQEWCRKFYLEASARYWGEPDTTFDKGTSALSACEALLARKAIDRFEWIANWNAGPEQLRYALLELGPLCVGSNWYTSMDSPNVVDGVAWMKVNYSSTLRGGHEWLLVTIDLEPADGSESYVEMLNSWGPGWGVNGKARFTLPQIDELVFGGWGDAVLIHELPRSQG
jgi:hypothetical protein